MIQVTKQLNLTERALGVHVIIKGVGDFLDRHHLVRLRIQHGAAKSKRKFNQQSKREKRIKELLTASRNDVPNDAVRAATDRHDRRPVLAGDLEEVSEYVVLNVLSAVRRNRREIAVTGREVSH